MKLATWTPSYSVTEAALKQKDKILQLSLDKKLSGEYGKTDIAIVVLGLVEHYNLAQVGSIVKATTEVLDALDALEIKNQYFVICKYLDKGAIMLGELKDFEAETFETTSTNPVLSTEIAKKTKKCMIVAGVESDCIVMNYVTSLLALKQSGKSPLEHILVLDSCTNAIGENKEARNDWGKYLMQRSGAQIISLYRGETKIA